MFRGKDSDKKNNFEHSNHVAFQGAKGRRKKSNFTVIYTWMMVAGVAGWSPFLSQ